MKKKLRFNFHKDQERIGGKGFAAIIEQSKFVSVKYYEDHKEDGVWVFFCKTNFRKKNHFDSSRIQKERDIGVHNADICQEKLILHLDCYYSYNNLGNMFEKHVKSLFSKSMNLQPELTQT